MFEAYAQTVEGPVGTESPAGSLDPDTLDEALQADSGIILNRLQF